MTRVDAPRPLRRRGPRPLWLHLACLTLPLAPGAKPPPLPDGLDRAMLAGIAAYRRHPYYRTLADPPTIWAEGASRLLDYGKPGALPVLFVPSLVNRAYVLDLMQERSMLRWLAARGVRPLLFDWGWPDQDDRRLGLDELVAGRLARAIAAVGKRVVLAGYCMGGLLALAAALRLPRRMRGLALLAAPWDFHAGLPDAAARFAASIDDAELLMAPTGTLPIDVLQAVFASVSPGSVAAKFRQFARTDQAGAAARDFVALEDWLNDGVPLAAPVARTVFAEWYRDNLPGRGAWRLGGEAVMPQALRCPAFAAVPVSDRIVPPASTLPLAALIPGAILHRPAAGHIGMVAGPRAEAVLWQGLLHWLQGL